MKKSKIFLRFLIFFALFLLLYAYMCFVFLPKDEKDFGYGKYYGSQSYKYEKDNTLDVILFGNSDLYNGFSTMDFYEQTGATSFVMSAGQQTVRRIVAQVKKTLKKQKPKLVVIETDCFFTKNKTVGGSFWYDMAPFVAPFKYHTRWKQLEWKDFYCKPGAKRPSNCFKGFLYETKNSHFKVDPDFMKKDERAERIQKSVKSDVKKILSLCEKKYIDVMFITFPSCTSWSMAKHNAVEKMCNLANVPYIDMNIDNDEFKFDYANCFKDNGNHMNYRGAKSATDYVTGFIKKNFQLPDRREDEKYQEWNELYDKFKIYRANNPVEA